MKRLVIALGILIILAPVSSYAQGPQLNSYTFGEGIVISGDEGFSMKLSGIIQQSFESKLYTDPAFPDPYNRFRIRRLNIKLSGDAIREKIEYGLQIDLSGTGETGDASSGILMDAWLAYNLNKQIQITFGQRSTHTDNRELTMGSQTLQLVERSRLTSAFSNIREFGIFIDGTFNTGANSYLKPYLTITNGDGINVMQKDHGGLKFGGRIDYIPFGLFRNFGQFRQADIIRELTPKLVIGANLSHNTGISSRNGRESGTILYLDSLSNETLPNFTKYGVDFMFKYRGFSVIGEFTGTSATVPTNITQRVRTDGTIATTFDVNGVTDVDSYVKERMILGKGYNIQAGYVFKNRFSLDARYTNLQADAHSFLNNGTFYNRPYYYTVGVSKYLSKGYGLKIQGSATLVKTNPGSNNVNGLPVTGNELIFNVLTSIAF